jgi:hypothetical protein
MGDYNKPKIDKPSINQNFGKAKTTDPQKGTIVDPLQKNKKSAQGPEIKK